MHWIDPDDLLRLDGPKLDGIVDRFLIDLGSWRPMAPLPDSKALWQARCADPGDTARVRAWDAAGPTGMDPVQPAHSGLRPPRRRTDGSNSDRIGPWPERGVLHAQLGPNRNGRKW